MSIPSGGAPLGPQDPTSIDATDMQQTGAASQTQRQDIGMTKDTLNQNFTELASTKLGVKGSEPGRPSLDHPVTSVTVAPGAQDTSTQAAVQEKYQQMLEKLPVDLQMAVLQNQQLPVEQQDPKLTAFNAGLMAEATMTVWADQVLAKEAGVEGTPQGTEGAAQGEGDGVVLDADGNPIVGQTAIGGQNGDGGGDTEGQRQPGSEITPQTQQNSAQFWATGATVPGADAREFVQANLPPGASTLDQAILAAVNGVPGPIVANLPQNIQKMLVAANATQVLTAQQTTVQAQLAATPPNDPSHVVLSDFLKIIGEAINACKEALRLMMSAQTEIEDKDAKAKTDTMMGKLKIQLEKLEKSQEASGKGGGTGKLIGMIILSIAAAVLTVVTGGILAILLAETVVGTIVMIAVTVALAVLELVLTISASVTTVNVVAEIMKLLAEMLNLLGIPSPSAEILVAIVVLVVAILAIVVAVLLVVICPSGSELIATMVLEIVITLSVTVVANSNAVATVCVPLLMAMGIPKEYAEIIAQIITMLLILIMVLGALAAGGAAVSKAGKAVASTGDDVAKGGAKAGSATATTGAKAAAHVETTGAKAGTGTARGAQSTEALVESTGEGATRSSWAMNKAGMKFSPATKTKVLEGLNAVDTVGQMGVQGGQSAMALANAIVLFKKAQLAMEIGDLDLLIAQFEAYLKTLDASMKAVQEALEELMKSITALTQLMSHIIQSQSQMVSSLERIS